METDLTAYVHKKMVSDANNYQWRIVFDSYKRALEVYFIISLEMEEDYHVQDVNGQVNRQDLLYFEDVICFYDENNHLIVPENYLRAFPFDTELGIEEGLVDAFLKQLNIMIGSAKTQLREFFLDAGQKEFSLEWNETNFKQTIETLIATNHYSTKRRTFEKQDDKSLVDQFKEDQYDGVERI